MSIDPFFSPSILTFLQMYGAILAVPNIRGGSEFGEDWHLGGIRERKASIVFLHSCLVVVVVVVVSFSFHSVSLFRLFRA